MATLHEILDNLGGALRIVGNLISQSLTRSHYRYWGATQEEQQRILPGDERVPNPSVLTTMAITIDAPASEVWPWVAQLGQERGGMYSYELLENIARCKMRNADRIVPEWEMKVGDQMRMGPQGYPVNQVVALERGHWLLMAGADLKTGIADPLPQPGQTTYINYAWVLYLDERARWHDTLDLAHAAGLCAAHFRRQVDVGSVHRSDRVCDDAQDAVDHQAARGAIKATGDDTNRRRLRLVGQVSAQGQV